MTLVVAFAINSYPVMLADILLSAQGGPYPFDLPSIRHMLPADRKMHPVGIRQKLTVISNEIVIGWSGRASTAQREIQQLRKLNEAEPLAVDALRESFIAMESRISPGELALIGFLHLSEAKQIQPFNFRGNYFEHAHYGPVLMLGSGMRYLQDYLEKQVDIVSSNTLNRAEFGVAFALRTAGDLLSREFGTQKTLDEFFGGGYEVIAPDWKGHGRFEKVNGITFLFWFVRLNDLRFKLVRAVKTWYVRDILYIRTAELDEPTMKIRIRSEPHVVLPIDRPIQDDDYGIPPGASFNSSWISHHFFIAHPNTKRMYVFPWTSHYVTGDPLIKFEEEKHQLRFELQDENEIVEFIKESYSLLGLEAPNPSRLPCLYKG